jgi:hypothetical protein
VSGALPAAGSDARRVLTELVRPTVRSTAWAQLTAGGALTVLLVLATCGSADVWAYEVVDRIRIAMVLLAVGVAGTLDDPTRPHLDNAPVRLVVRQILRLVVALTVTAGWWALTLLSAEHHPLLGHHRPRGLPLAGLSIEGVGLVAVTLAVAAAVTRSHGTSGALAAAGTALGVPAVLMLWTPLRHALYPRYELGTDPAWWAAHQRWLAVAVAACVAVMWALRDPATRMSYRWRALGRRRVPSDPASSNDEGARG